MSVDRKLLWLGLLSGVIALIVGAGGEGDTGLTLLAIVATAAVLLVLDQRSRRQQ